MKRSVKLAAAVLALGMSGVVLADIPPPPVVPYVYAYVNTVQSGDNVKINKGGSSTIGTNTQISFPIDSSKPLTANNRSKHDMVGALVDYRVSYFVDLPNGIGPGTQTDSCKVQILTPDMSSGSNNLQVALVQHHAVSMIAMSGKKVKPESLTDNCVKKFSYQLQPMTGGGNLDKAAVLFF